jgi:hypothetical protein
MKIAAYIVISLLVPFFGMVTISADEGAERRWLSKTDGTFKGPSGTVTLAYKGEGTIEVTLKTERCSVLPATTEAGTVSEQVAVLSSSAGITSLVIFFETEYIVLLALDDFSRIFCEGGQDVDGKYLLIRQQ